jgi:acyl dehydratase
MVQDCRHPEKATLGLILVFDELSEGDEAPVLTHTLTRADLVQYAGASGDFNPMHTDEVAAQAAGMKSVFGHGMFSAGLLATAITNWAGIGSLKRYNVRFVKQAWPGERFASQIAVAAKRVQGHEHLVDLACALVNEDGEVKVEGEATVTAAGPGGSG